MIPWLRARAKEKTLLSRPVSDLVDIPGDVCRCYRGLSFPRSSRRHQLFSGGNDQHPYRHRVDSDDVPAAGQGEIRTITAGFSKHQGIGAVPDSKLGHRSGPDVPSGRRISDRSQRIHGRLDSYRSGPLHCDGDCLERPCSRGSGVLCRASGFQLDFYGTKPVLFPRSAP
jgi:hypothetical protein